MFLQQLGFILIAVGITAGLGILGKIFHSRIFIGLSILSFCAILITLAIIPYFNFANMLKSTTYTTLTIMAASY